jgi:hypothetical protein
MWRCIVGVWRRDWLQRRFVFYVQQSLLPALPDFFGGERAAYPKRGVRVCYQHESGSPDATERTKKQKNKPASEHRPLALAKSTSTA